MDAACSRFRRDSELWRVNHARGRPVTVSPLFADALTVALDAAELTDGDVDPTCGQSLVRLGYDRDFALARQRTDPLRQPPMPAGGWRRVELDRGHPAVRVPAGILLDLGATAKALAADRAAAAVQAAVGGGVLVNLGGDIRVAGDPPDGGWPVGVADDADFDTSTASVRPRQVVMVRDGGLATSSPLGRTWRRGDARLHHIVDPVTGQARPVLLAHRQRRRRELRRREHRQHRGDPARRACDRLAGRARPARPPRPAGRHGRHRGRLAGLLTREHQETRD